MLKRLLYALSSALLLSIPWWGGPSAPLLVGFVPLLLLQRELDAEGKRCKMWPWAALSFALWWGATTFWVAYAAFIGIVAAVIIGTLLCGGAFMIYHAVRSRAPKGLAYTIFVTAWLAYEYLYTTGEISFPWLNLGNGFANDVWLVQWYEYTGTFGGTLWVLVANLLIFEAICRWRSWRAWVAPALWVLLPAGLSLIIYASFREPLRTAEATVIQPNLEPYTTKFKMQPGEVRALLLDMIAEAPAGADFIVAPETAMPEHPQEFEFETSPTITAIQDFVRARASGVSVICGAMTYRYYLPGEESLTARRTARGDYYDYFNSALGIDSTDRIKIHHKSILVTGAEKMPYYTLLKHLEFLIVDLGGITGQLGVDTRRRIFEAPGGTRYGTAVCYESIYGGYFADFVRNGAELMFVITNDGWWRDTPGYRNHFAFSRLRAIETRRAIVRSANTGISGFITPRGDVGPTLGWDKRGTLTDRVGLNNRITFFVRYGDLIGRIGSYVFVLCLLYFMAYRIRKRSHMEK